MSEYDISIPFSRGRQQRLLAVMQELKLDLVIVNRIEHVQYLAGPRFAWTFEPAVALWADGHCTLVAPNQAPAVAAADEVVTYAAQWHSTLRNDQRHASSQALLAALAQKPKPRRVGVEFSVCGPHITQELSAELVDIEPALFKLRRKKDPDELARIKKAIAGTGAMYAAAREMIEPGVSELDVFNTLQGVAVREFGEMLTGTGNDYACGVPGGAPRPRAARDGELYILDLGPAFRGYFADNCRAFAVNRRPTDDQHQAWERIAEVFTIVQRFVKPGASCRQLFELVNEHLVGSHLGKFEHHLGHGIGLFPHEAPHLNPHWDDTFEVGEVFTAEPGLYGPTLHGGIRLENDYLVTPTGVELLSDFPLKLA
ncbi:MAG: aminopeptidase P family protein [Planctomycetes bacterium]|nr:aminopeptidase P family protein [Planctomycetota bacterium]